MGLLVTAATTSVADSAALYGAAPNNTTANTQEQIFSPIIIRKGASGGGAIPSFEPPQQSPYEWGPFGNGKAVGPTRSELDPYFSNTLGDDGSRWMKECDYQIMVNNATATVGSRDINIRKTRRDMTTVTAAALRGPLMLSGWGYDVCDKPTPAQAASGAASFEFDQNIVNNRGTWKTGPVNLQWDDERKVWQGGPQIVCGVASGSIRAPVDPCNPQYFFVKVLRRVGAPNQLDACVLGEKITVANRDPSLTQEATSGMVFVVAVRINYEWIPIWVGCPDGPSSGNTPSCVQC